MTVSGKGKKIFVIVNGKQILIITGEGLHFRKGGIAQMILLKSDHNRIFMKNQNKIICFRLKIFIFIVINMRVNVLYHIPLSFHQSLNLL